MVGLPIIAFDCPAAKEFVEHGKNGFLANNVEEMKQYIMTYYNKPELIKYHAEFSRKKALEKFSPDIVIPEMVKYIKGI